jgi:pyruvate dehydrogenase E2 component (dihydrolipoamide acetyltransferase)
MRERGIDPSRVRGTGPGGRIVEADVLRMPPAGTLSPMRRAIARITTASAAVPQFTLRAEVDATELLAFRAMMLEHWAAESGPRLSIGDLLLRAQALALRTSPRANRIWKEDTIIALPDVGVGLVVSLDDGLIVPVIRDADRLELKELVRQRTEVVRAAREGRLRGEAMTAVASSLSNLGHSRVDDFSAILYPPQSSMLAVWRIVPRPFVVDGQVCARPTLRLSLTVDHRVLDGAPAAEFLGRIVEYLSEPGVDGR